MFTSSVGLGFSQDSFKAGVESAINAREGLAEGEIHIAIVFASPLYTQADVLSGIQSVIGTKVLLVGASTAGEITGAGPTKSASVTTMFISSDSVQFFANVQENAPDNEEVVGQKSHADISAQTTDEIQLVMMFSDGLTVNPVAAIRGMQEAAGRNLPIVGGSAADNGAFVKTFQYYNGAVYSNSIVSVWMTGRLDFAVGVRHGWIPIGTPRKVTASKGTLLQEIDGKPAIDLYKEYLGEDEAKNLKEVQLGEIALSYPLGVKDSESGELLLRAPFSVDETGSITCGGEFKVGDSVQMMIGSRDEALVAAKESAQKAVSGMKSPAKAAIIFSCHVRNTLFGSKQKAAGEVRAITDVIGSDVPLIGFYTYAEQAPIAGETKNLHKCNSGNHNETLVTVLLGEKPL